MKKDTLGFEKGNGFGINILRVMTYKSRRGCTFHLSGLG